MAIYASDPSAGKVPVKNVLIPWKIERYAGLGREYGPKGFGQRDIGARRGEFGPAQPEVHALTLGVEVMMSDQHFVMAPAGRRQIDVRYSNPCVVLESLLGQLKYRMVLQRAEVHVD